MSFYKFWKTNIFSSTETFWYLQLERNTAWKVSVFGVFLVRIFPSSDWIRSDTPNPSKFSPNAGKCGLEKLRIRTLFTQCQKLFPVISDRQFSFPSLKGNNWVQYLFLSFPYFLEICTKMKINLNFYFHTFLWCLKLFCEDLKVFIKPFETPKRSAKTKI